MPPFKFKLRWGQKADALELGVLEAKAQIVEGRTETLHSATELETLWRLRLERGTKLIVAYESTKHKILGFLSFKGELSAGMVHALYVEPSLMRQGIGGMLLRTAGALCMLKGGDRLKVRVLMHNLRAQAFYSALHFRATGVQSSHLIIMEKEL